MARPAAFESLPLLGEAHGQVRRYAPRFPATFDFRSAPVTRGVIEGIDTLRAPYRDHKRALPTDAPVAFLRKQWKAYVLTEAGLDRSLYEMAALTELRNSLRSGDVWVPGSRQFKDFEDYLLPKERFAILAAGAAWLENEVCALLPHVKITDLLLEVDRWCDFTRHFKHLRTDQPTKDRPALLTVVLADAINLGLSKNGGVMPWVLVPQARYIACVARPR